LTLDPDAQDGYSGQFQLQAEGVELRDFRLDELHVAGELDKNQLNINQLSGRLGGDSTVEGRMRVNFGSGEIRDSQFDLDLGPGFLGGYLPPGYRLNGLTAKLELQGAMKSLQHHLEAEIDGLESKDLKPLKLSLSSQGELVDSGMVKLRARTETGERIESEFDYEVSDGRRHGVIQAFSWQGPEGLSLELEEPAELWMTEAKVPELRLEDLRLSGEDCGFEMDVVWGSEGKEVKLVASNLDLPLWASSWTKHNVANVLVRSMKGELRQENELWLGSLDTDAIVRQGGESIALSGKVMADVDGLGVEGLQLADEQRTWVSVQGHLPLLFGPGFKAYYQLNMAAPMELEMQTENHQAWIDLINPVLPVALRSFNANIHVQGSPEEPEGVVRMSLSTQGGEGEQAIPPVQVEVDGLLQGRLLSLDQLRMVVQDQLFIARGEVRFPENAISFLMDRSVEVDWKKTAFDFSVEDSSLVPLAYLTDDYIRPGGMINAKLQGDLEDGFDGEVHLAGLSSKAVFPFGSFREISADLVFDDSQAELRSFAGKIGREPVKVMGSVDYHDFQNPVYELTLHGVNLPLVRQAGMLLRADLDLAVRGNRKDGVLVDGRIGLKDGLYMLSLADLGSGGGGQSTESYPPYFSVEEEPFAKWKLDVDIVGERFMSFFTPALKAVVSMDMNLLGTLQEPLLNGEISIDEGAVLFPFAQFEIDRGTVVFPVGDPYRPKLDVQASSQRLGYDLMLFATGEAFDPEIVFDSNPSLSSEQILMLVVAGENPNDTLEYGGTTRASRIGTYMTMGLWGSGPNSSGIGSRFSMESGSSLSRQGKETMQMEFMLGEDWYLVGEYDEYDAWNGGVRWRILNPSKRRRMEEPEDEE